MRIFTLLLFTFSFLFASSNEMAFIAKIDGKVKVLKSDGFRASKAKEQQKLYKGDLIITYKNSTATIQLTDNSLVTLDQKTKLKVEDLKNFKQEEGTVFYNIETQGSKSLEVATSFATIGVKGTKFIVKSEEDKNVALKSGLVSIESLDGEFEIHKKKQRKLTEYEVYMMAHKYEFDKYKKKIEEEFIEYKKQFDLQPNKYVSFDGNVVKEDTLTKDIENDFKRFENLQK
jgi:hypothetical protein